MNSNEMGAWRRPMSIEQERSDSFWPMGKREPHDYSLGGGR